MPERARNPCVTGRMVVPGQSNQGRSGLTGETQFGMEMKVNINATYVDGLLAMKSLFRNIHDQCSVADVNDLFLKVVICPAKGVRIR